MRRRMMRPARIAPMAAVPLAALLIGVVLALPLHLQPDASRMCSGAAGVGIVHAQTTDECTDPTVPPPTVPPPTVPPPTVPPPTVPPETPPPTAPPPTVPPTAPPTVPRSEQDGFAPLFADEARAPRALPRTGGADGAAAALTALAAIIAGLGAWLRGRR